MLLPILILSNLCMTIFSHEREQSPVETEENFCRVARFNVYVRRRRHKGKVLKNTHFPFCEKRKAFNQKT